MKRIQIAISEEKYAQARAALVKNGVTWQQWGEEKIDEFIVNGWGEPLMEMAINRDQFETKIQEKVVGALREQAFILLAVANGQKKWVEHKRSEVERLGLELLDVFDYRQKGKWSQKKAARQAIEYYRDKLSRFITKAVNAYVRYYGVSPKKMIDDRGLFVFLDEMIASLPDG